MRERERSRRIWQVRHSASERAYRLLIENTTPAESRAIYEYLLTLDAEWVALNRYFAVSIKTSAAAAAAAAEVTVPGIAREEGEGEL